MTKQLLIHLTLMLAFCNVTLFAKSMEKSLFYNSGLLANPPAITISDTTVMPGDTLRVAVYSSDITGLGLYSCEINLTFNPDFLQALEAEKGTLMTPDWIMDSNTFPGEIRIALAGIDEFTGAGSIVIVPFIVNPKALPGDSSILHFSRLVFNEDMLNPTGKDGKISVLAIADRCRYWSDGSGVNGVMMELSGSRFDTTFTYNDGYYGFSVEKGDSYSVTSKKENDAKVNAISAYDVSLVLKHILQINTLTGNECVAADVSGNKDITSYDASLMLKYSVGAIQHFPIGDWNFQPECRNYDRIDRSFVNEDYIAVLYGDVSGNYSNKKKSVAGDTVLVRIPEIAYNNKDTINVPIQVEGMVQGIIACDITVTFDSTVLKALKAKVGIIVPSGWMVESYALPGRINIALSGTEGLNGDGNLIWISFVKVSNARMEGNSVLHLANVMFDEGKVAAKPEDGTLFTGTGIADNSTVKEQNVKLEVYQNRFTNSTNITYYLPVKTKVSLEIYDISGRTATTLVNEDKEAGKHNIDLASASFPTGIYFAKFSAGKYKETKKLVLMK